MKQNFLRNARASRVWRTLCGAMILMASLLPVLAQAQSQGVIQNVGGMMTGTIERLEQDDGRIIISGRSFSYQPETTEVYRQGRSVFAALLDEGMVVRFTVNSEGTLRRVDILGPFNQTRILDQH